MRAISVYLVVSLLIFTTSCLIQTPDENFVRVEQIADPQYQKPVSYSMNGTSFYELKDTLWSPGYFYLGVNALDVEVYVGEKRMSPFGRTDRPLFISVSAHAPGMYRLRIKLRVKSGTGSVADKLGAEYAEYEVTRVLAVVDQLYYPTITNIGIVDGSLKIEWNKAGQTNFEGFKLYKYKSLYEQFPYQTIVITDQRASSYLDQSYVGGPVVYKLVVNRGGDLAETPRISYSSGYVPRFELSASTPGNLKLQWATPLCYNSVGDFTVYRQGQVFQAGIESTKREIEFPGTAVFGISQNYRMILKGKTGGYEGQDDQMSSYDENITLGKRLPAFKDLVYNKEREEYFLSHRTPTNQYFIGLYRLDRSLHTIDSVIYPFMHYPTEAGVKILLSPDGTILYTLHQTGLLEIRDPDNLASVTKTSVGEFNISSGMGNYIYGSDIEVTNNNLLLIRTSTNHTIVLDMNQRKKISESFYGNRTSISADGKYLARDHEIFVFTGTGFGMHVALPYTQIQFLQFIDEAPSMLIVVTPSKVYVYNCDTMSEVHAWDLNSSFATVYPTFNQSTGELQYKSALHQDPVYVFTHLNVFTGSRRTVLAHEKIRTYEGEYMFDDTGFAYDDF